ncbi:hypothetical protein GO755_04505 [Spirosoma sp. HMF4905]|uniref:RadC-like JAB domain-containing protein n=1 Tax=Spirosoma arboris TaxID=2682092 RepID=A0A7K1S638_9BACT|nr:hypothetical protein [Spirosoma arboris]MVM29283.1 hypothetical protein [Spirosoma arboris]
MITGQMYLRVGDSTTLTPQTVSKQAHSTARNYKRQANQLPILPLVTRSKAQAARSSKSTVSVQPTDQLTGFQNPIPTGKTKPQVVESPFQAALLLTAANHRGNSDFSAFVCYLNGKQVVAIERLHRLRGHNPEIDLTSILSRALRDRTINGVIIATWHRPTAEDLYAAEFEDEVERQYQILLEADIRLVDNLRLSETGMYSYYGFECVCLTKPNLR